MGLELQTCEDTVEIARLTNKIPLLTRCLGGLLPGVSHEHIVEMRQILEVACGPGVWMQELAQAYQHVQITGIDARPAMVCQATSRLKEAHSSNAVAQHVDTYSDPFPFEDSSFDLISIQFMSLFLRVEKWPALLAECKRVLRPSGIIRITEFELAQSNAPAQEEWWQFCWQMLKLMDRSPSLSNRYLGWFYELEPMIYAAGFQECKSVPHVVNYSYGTLYHEEWKRDLNLQARKYLPLMVEKGILTQEQSVSLKARVEDEMNHPNFHAIQPFLTVVGKKSRPGTT